MDANRVGVEVIARNATLESRKAYLAQPEALEVQIKGVLYDQVRLSVCMCVCVCVCVCVCACLHMHVSCTNPTFAFGCPRTRMCAGFLGVSQRVS